MAGRTEVRDFLDLLYLDRLILSGKHELPALKRQWLAALEKATTLVNMLPGAEMGCLYLNARGEAVVPDPGAPDFAGWHRHFGSAYGAWPTILP